MRIGIDARFVGTPGGIGRYVEELVRAMLCEAANDRFVLFLRSKGLGRIASDPRVEMRRADVSWYGLGEQLRMPSIVRSARADLVHWPHWNVPMAAPKPFVVTIHDLILLDYPSIRATTLGPLAYRAKSLGFRAVLKNAVRSARAVLVPTEYVRGRVLETFRLPEDRVVVTGEGVTALPKGEPEAEERVRAAFGIKGPYLLAVGNAYPHKNLEGLLDAFRILRKAHASLTLVIAGHGDYFFERVRKEAHRSGRASGVLFIPSPTDAEVAALYRGARVFVTPSFLEGFGLPPLEAMAEGVPVVASRAGSLPETLGEAARYVDPHAPEDIAEGLRAVLEDNELSEHLKTKGKERAKHWQWPDAARKTLQTYRESV